MCIRDRDGYLFVNDYNGVVLAHHFKPALEGTNVLALKDQNGIFYFREFIDQAKQKGSGYVEYLFDKPSKGKAVTKPVFISMISMTPFKKSSKELPVSCTPPFG